MKLKNRNPRKENSGIPDVPIIVAFESASGELVPEDKFHSFCAGFLKECGATQKELIVENVNKLPQRSDDDFGSKWARDNVEKPDALDLPDDYIEKFWTLNGDKIEAARLILAHRERDRIATGFDEIGWDSSCEQLKEHVSPDEYLDWRLVKNIQASGKHPELPEIKHPRFPYNQMNNQVCQQVAFSDVVYCHNMAIGSRRFDIIFYMGDLEGRYFFIQKVGRPTVRLVSDERVAFDFSVIEEIPVRDVHRGHVVTFDRNMDHEYIISGARMSKDGTISRELGPSLDTVEAINKLKKWQVERARCAKKIANLMPDCDVESKKRLVEQKEHLDELIANKKEEIDWLEVNDIRCHVLPDEMLGIEQLDMFGGGYVKFRHGSTDDKLEHATARDGGQLVHVSPAGSSTKCPTCHKKMVKNKEGKTERCPKCGYEAPHDYGANVTLGVRTFKKMDINVTVDTDNLPSVQVQEERSRKKREQRQAKMDRRSEKGARTYRIKDKATPRRPKRDGRTRMKPENTERAVEPAMTLEELKDLFVGGYEAHLMSMKEENELNNNNINSNKGAGALCSVAPLLPWASTNTFVGGSGWSTCHVFFEDLYVRSMLAGVIRPPGTSSEKRLLDVSGSTPLQENINNSQHL